MTDEKMDELQVLFDLRSWHRRQIEQALGDIYVVHAHEQAILRLHRLSAAKRHFVAEGEVTSQRDLTANAHTGMPQT